MSGIAARVEEGTNLILDEEEIAFAAGWSSEENGSSIDRIGETILASLQVRFAAKSAKLVATLPVPYRPLAPYTTPDGKFTVAVDGKVECTESLVELETALGGGKYLTLNGIWRAAVQTP